MSVDVHPIPPAVTAPARLPRLWIGAFLVCLFWAANVAAYRFDLNTPARFFSRLGAAILLELALLIWWWSRRRVGWAEKAIGFFTVIGTGVIAAFAVHRSVGPFGLLMIGLPAVLTTGLAWLYFSRRAPVNVRRLGLLGVVVATWALFTVIRINGLDGEQRSDVRWRWTPTAEDQFLAERRQSAGESAAPAADLSPGPGDWPGFRGPDRDGVVRGLVISTDWSAHPPKELWRHRVGPGWSSVAVVGGRLFTQEQRGDAEAVVCYDAATGREVWAHTESGRFEEPVSGAGPRATPAVAGGRVFALTAAGKLVALNGATGESVWSRDAAADAAASRPQWAFCSSPLVVGNLVVVLMGGDAGKGLAAYRMDTGAPAWTADVGVGSYTSPQPAALAGVPQILTLTDRGVSAVDPATGAVLWSHAIPLPPGAPRSIQPRAINDHQVLVSSEADLGTALIDVSHDSAAWSAERRWQSRDLKPSFNDTVVRDGFAYGFDGHIFCCLDLATGKRRWKDGRYGHGQVVLLAEQGLLLVTTETGDAVLLAADPAGHRELGRFRAVEGKTWNHPAVAGGRLYVRNAEELACFELK
ncbi:MAG TPA: PQQ-binding-like beta-propeller repeat protein [Gemmataceae bacterium]|jgi:outer membrane protein assembly factor BamB